MSGETWTYSEDVIAKAHRYLDEGRVMADVVIPGIYWVRGSAKRLYRVQTDADPVTQRATWAACTCLHGGNRDFGTARCSHVVAVLIAVRDSLTLPKHAQG